MRNRLVTSPQEILDSLLKTPFRPSSFMLDGKSIPYMRLEVPFPVNDLIDWLSAQKLFPKVYFETSQDGMTAGIGCALKVNHIPSFGKGLGPRFYGGSDFMPRKKKTWGVFPSCAYFLPLIQIEKRDEGTFLILNRVSENVDVSIEEESPISSSYTLGPVLESPSFPVWGREVSEVLKGIQRDDYLKVVLAKCTKQEFDGSLSPYHLLKSLQGKNRFAFQFSKEQTFIGNTPETLYRRHEGRIESAAIAGTRPRGESVLEDEKFEDALINCPKERHEVQVVRDMVVEALSPLCQSLQIESCKVLKTSTVQHLHHHIEGTLKEEFEDKALVNALHPTPAVGGYPRQEAFSEIAKRESFDRGWYAAPVGYISAEKSHLLVAIRSALIDEESIRLFAGTGLVSGSNPSREWDELKHKISQYTRLL